MEVDSSTANHVDEVSKGQSLKKAPTMQDSRPPASEMTSADYYFDSYAHFGEKPFSRSFFFVHKGRVLTVYFC